MEFIKDNKLIAEFMKYPEGFPHYTDQFGYHQCMEGYKILAHVRKPRHYSDSTEHEFPINELLFNTAWDWLIPVIDKIDELLPEDTSVQLSYNRCVIHNYEWNQRWDIIDNTRITAAYKAVIEFITWYNKEKENDK